jgi:predicted acylesterase/phospholipase RssA
MIYTFYSYKGGVGRSMALANVAECFYEKGLRVLIVDWDLEAPGLESFFFEAPQTPASSDKDQSADEGAAVRSRLGLIDMLQSYRQMYARLPLTASPSAKGETPLSPVPAIDVGKVFDEHLPPMSDYVTPIHAGNASGAGLWLLSAGWRQNRFPEYARAVQNFDWDEFYNSFSGEAYFEWMRRQFSSLADVILIDSRTGVTEMGGVCARQLADVVLSFCAPNFQNLDGVSKMMRSFRSSEVLEARNNRPIELLVVPTRVDNSELDRLGNFKEWFHSQIETQPGLIPQVLENAERPFWELQIPYLAKFAYLEQRVVGPGTSEQDPTGQLPRAYWRIATLLAVLAPANNPVRRQFATEISRDFPQLHSGICVLYADDEGQRLADPLAEILRGGGISVQISDAATSAGIGNAETLALILTTPAIISDGVRRQVRLARQSGRCIYLVPPAGALAGTLPSWLSPLPVIDIRKREKILAVLGARCRTEPIPMMAPELPELSVRRDALLTELRAAIDKAPIVALAGLVGVGKSILAAQFCRDDDVADAFPGGTIWLNSDPSGSPSLIHRQLHDALFGSAEVFNELSGPERITQRLMRARHLIVIEDVEKNKAIDEIFRLNRSGVCLILTRSLDAAMQLAPAVIRVGVFSDEEGISLMTQGLVHDFQQSALQLDDQIRDLVVDLGYWPAAVHLGAIALRAQFDDLKNSPAQTASNGNLAEAAIAKVSEEIGTHGVLAFDPIARARKMMPVAGILRSALAVLSPSEREYLAQLAQLDGAIDLDEAREVWGLNLRRTNTLLKRFESLSLLSRDENGSINLPLPIVFYLTPLRALTARRKVSSSLDRQSNPDVLLATAVLARRQRISAGAAKDLVRALKTARYFDLARQVAARMPQTSDAEITPDVAMWFAQQQALCTYKDPDLPADQRLDDALKILQGNLKLETTTVQETLGLAGALYKRKWEINGQRENLDRSLAYYLRGYQQGILTDDGYTGINAAFILDLLAAQEEDNATGVVTGAGARRDEARRVREDIVARLTQKVEEQRRRGPIQNPWFLFGTLGEANFGLGRYDEALYWLREALENQPADWEYETTARQLAEIARLQAKTQQGDDEHDAWKALRQFLGDDVAAANSVKIGKVGLSLSGGGFRASLFHIGVLARLAECDLLRHIEVLSCVSGGSIIGAHYYLEVRHLLQTNPDSEITRDDYVALIKRMATNFLRGVQRNIRSRLTSEFVANLKMAVVPDYTTSQRLGELYEEEIYRLVDDGENDRERWLNEMIIQPRGEGPEFTPKLDNWRRGAKVPILILNATTLNTGHNWQFTASWMGESPSNITTEIEANDRLRRLYYWQAPKDYQRIRLGHAVAASACVPGLFEPLSLPGIYPDRIVHLVDGGLNDNQGVASLLEQDCAVFLISDATGQMQTIRKPRSELYEIPMRANSILMARVREAEFRELDARRRASLIRGLMFLHLKKELDVVPVDWIGAQEPENRAGEADDASNRTVTSYGVDKEVQEQLAAIRTDLDSFNDTEAYALMASGYLMTKHELPKALSSIAKISADEPSGDWMFLEVEDDLRGGREQNAATERFNKLLRVGGSTFGKPFRLNFFGSLISFAIPLCVAALACYLAVRTIGVLLDDFRKIAPAYLAPLVTKIFSIEFWRIAEILGVLILAGLAVWIPAQFIARRKSITQFLYGLVFAATCWFTWIHLRTTDLLYLRLGRVSTNKLTKMRELAAQYESIREGMTSGAARTRLMQAIVDAMTIQTPGARRFLSTLQASESAGEHLAAIAILQAFPDARELDWLASRLDPEAEQPFIGFQAAVALQRAVRALPGDKEKLKSALDTAVGLAERNKNDPPRLTALNAAQRELSRTL